MASSMPTHYLVQWWLIVSWNLGHKHQRNLNGNTEIFIDETGFEIIIWKMLAIWSRHQYVQIIVGHQYSSPSNDHQGDLPQCLAQNIK